MKKKKLLLIGVRYFDYTQAIIAEIERQGYAVTFYEILPWSLRYKILFRLSPARYRRERDQRHKAILEKEKNNLYDVVFFLQVHQFSLENINALRSQHAESKFVLYNWDSVVSLASLGFDYRQHMQAFDCVYTFDPNDAKALGIGHLPLFCVRSFQSLDKTKADSNAVYFVGNVENARRYRAVAAFKDYCRREGICFDFFMACRPTPFLNLIFRGNFPLDVSFSHVPQDKFITMIESASAVFDFANHDQSGYTMRVMENLCAGKKLITNNANILNEPFYSSDRIFVFENLDFSGVKEFMGQQLTSSEDVFEKYHIQNFVKQLLC